MAAWHWWRRRDAEHDELDKELETHVALEIEEQRAAGKSLEDATNAAHRAFGSILLTKDELADLKSREIGRAHV